MRTLAFFTILSVVSSYVYNVTVSNKGAIPSLSLKRSSPGNSPCTCTFNPSFLEPQPGNPGLNASILILRASGCPANYGGNEDHLMFAYCDKNGNCGDLQPLVFPFEASAEDPRAFYYPTDGKWYLYYFANGPGQNTVYLRRSATPLDPNSWELVVSQLPWHRNGCVILRDDGNHYVIYGESGGPSKGPLPGIAIAQTRNFVNYTVLNATWLEPYGANGTQSEIVLEAASNVVQLSTGDYLHIYAAGTNGWVANGNYTGAAIILDKDDPTKILQRTNHIFLPTMDYEIGDGIWPVQRNRTLFVTSLIPVEGETDTFRVYYGAADANVATAILTVTYQ